ncbi:MAG: D-alanyl-D-alanine carboxypeptidase [Corallococcus sp.]|nr:D-alanyl-D-alanine carboxypeptidase [Corallococcus sp.]
MKKTTVLFILCCVLALLSVLPVIANAETAETVIDIKSKEAVLLSEKGDILFERNSTEKRPIASMTKIMTLLCVYDAIADGKLHLDDEVTVSQRAASMGGSQVFLDANTTHKVENLIKSIVVCSANDSCVALAEHISGSVENFVDKMNQKAQTLGLENTHFENCTGLPCVNHFSCALDVGQMMLKLIENPHYFTCSRVWMEDYQHPGGRVTGMTNTNRLIRFYDGCDGGKTGYTVEAQHCLSATAKRGDTRFVAVVVGAPDSKTRFNEVSSLFNYGFANYESKVYLDVNSEIEKVGVLGGKSDNVEIKPDRKLIGFGEKGKCDFQVVTDIPDNVKAPVCSGDIIGKAFLKDSNGNTICDVNLIAANDIECKGYTDYISDIILGK